MYCWNILNGIRLVNETLCNERKQLTETMLTMMSRGAGEELKGPSMLNVTTASQQWDDTESGFFTQALLWSLTIVFGVMSPLLLLRQLV
jgi:hypothetical protein